MTATKVSKKQMNNSVVNAFAIIDYLTGKDWCRIKDISEALDMDAAKVHRLINTMASLNYIEHDDTTRRYRLGYKFFTISYHMSNKDRLIIVAREPMEWAANQLLETINLGVLSDSKTKVTHIFKLEGNSEVYRIDSPIGGDTYTHASALGKAILAYKSPGEQLLIAQKISYKKFTDTTIDSMEAFLDELQKIRLNGYALDRGEYFSNVHCIATPIFSSVGLVTAAISISLLREISEDEIKRYYKILNEASRRISIALGYKAQI